MKKLALIFLLCIPFLASAQTYPTPIFNAITLQTPLTTASGGTGASTAPAARSALGAAAIGSNSDITALSALTTATITGGGLTVNPTSGSTNAGLTMAQTGPITGTTPGTNSLFCALGAACFNYNSISVSDGTNVTGTGTPYANALNVGMTTGTSNSQGSKFALSAQINVTGNTGVTNGDTGAAQFYATSLANQGGTNLTTGAAGDIFAIGLIAQANSGATNLFSVSGGEVDCHIQTGASAQNRFCWSIVDGGQVQGASRDVGFEIASAGGPGFQNGIYLDNLHGSAPLSTTGCLICTDSSTNTIGTGINLSAYTITGNFLQGPSSSFVVTGAGNVSAAGINNTPIGTTTASTGAFTTLTATGINSTPVGATTAATGKFTTLQATSGLNSTAVGNTTPSTGVFTTLSASSGVNSTNIGATTPGTGAFTTLSSSGLLSPNGGINGITSGSAPAAGTIGEQLTCTGTAVSLTTDVSKNVCTLTLTAGYWEVTGQIFYTPAGTTAVNVTQGGINTSTGALPTITTGGLSADLSWGVSTTLAQPTNNMTWTYNVSTSTPIYLVAYADFNTSTLTTTGFLRATRIH